ncbi:cation:H+ antiporter [Chromohalobacter marismortui]|uniref:Cation:H+ antiporter n=1 Tax=Chromohalobacter marismortui TaxID=42055 RepID=A0A4R7NPL1_9GAMM|nr:MULTISPECIES: calcium/sodium antiporter [Chromohalobacter]MCI0508807.1 calcium/sodium antiporter [Chromohalobacter sp.]MCI0594336.1 calcium/sodium antiporter [Chromohalobacter sp.]TDU22823.1 cation:H+ antiporter [Chromohalobacter marismortui]
MLMAIIAVALGLAILVWSADRFVEGAASTSRHLGLPPLLIGMVVIGFGTSAPELMVSAISAWQGNPGLALGNAYGSNIANIGLIVGIVALLSPLTMHSQVLRQELPLLMLVTVASLWCLQDGAVSRWDAVLLLAMLAAFLSYSILRGRQKGDDTLADNTTADLDTQSMTLKRAITWTLVGLVMLIVSSRLLVWGAVDIASAFGVSDLVIGLTVVAIGTSLPELASSISAVRKNEHDLVLGNVVGSNLFNTLAVVGLAGVIDPIDVDSAVLVRDWPVMAGLTLALTVFGIGWKGQGRINRLEGALLLATFIAYTTWLVMSVIGAR